MVVTTVRSKYQTFLIITGLVMLISLLWFLLYKTVAAESQSDSWSWTDHDPVLISSNPIPSIVRTYCKTPLVMKNIDGRFDKGGVCLTEGKKLNFGTTNFWWFGSGGVVSFPYDDKMYKVSGLCSTYDTCTYLPGSDTMIIKQSYSWATNARNFKVYRNFSKRLKLTVFGITREYVFDDSNPEYQFQDDQGRVWPINSSSASDNGKWMAVEFWDRGIGLFNTETLEMRRITDEAYKYGYGMDPSTELAVSDDGRHVAVMGVSSGIAVYDIDSSCGEAASFEVFQTNHIVNNCRKANINIPQFIQSFKFASYPRFNQSGGELNFYATSYSGDIREITMRASGYQGQRIDYLAMGDSYSSGEGETDDKYYLPGTNDEFEKCHLSSRSYPFLLAKLSNVDPLYMRSVACSGATTDDVRGGEVDYIGQGDRLGKDKMGLETIDVILAKTNARYSFIPGRDRQNIFVKEYKPGIVTIGVGGNDAGLISKLTACAGSGTCNWANDAINKEQAAKEIRGVFDKLVKTYSEISYISPNTKLIAIGYPKIVDPNGNCDNITGFLFDKTEREYMDESVKYLNQVVEAAAKAFGIKYVDIQDSFGNQVLCGSKSPSAMNGVRTGDDTNMLNDSEWFRFIGSEGFHPNSIGHAIIAKAIGDSIGNLKDYSYCPSGVVICPDSTVKAPEPSTYWMPGGDHSYPRQESTNFISDVSSTDSLHKNLVVNDFSLLPGSDVMIEVTSEPISLGHFSASDTGSLNMTIDLPVDLPEGYHTIRLYGTSYSGEQIELYQVFEYTKAFIKAPNPQNQVLKKTEMMVDTARPENNSGGNEVNNFTGNENTIDSDGTSILLSTPEVKGESVSLSKDSVSDKHKDEDLQYAIFIAAALLTGIVILLFRWLIKHKRR